MTNQTLTFNTLDSYFLNTGNMRLNIGYFRDSVRDQFDIVQRHTNGGNGKSLLIINKVQFEWSCFIDSLCKSGEITQRQYNRATF